MKIGYTTGVFDLFHYGHLNLLKKAKLKCDKLFVFVQSDQAAFKIKGKYPIMKEDERINLLRDLPSLASKVLIYNGTDESTDLHERIIEKINPDIFIKGSDWAEKEVSKDIMSFLKKNGINIEIIPYTKSISTSEIRSRFQEKQ
ncbi:MAG: adenylyltransferase/cytidyltransferase family protein [Minisyncoccales bacterium]